MRVTIDLMKKSTQIIDLSNVINPRVGDDDLLLPLHIVYDDNQTDMRGKDVEFLSNDPNKKNIYIAGTCNTNTPGDNLLMGNLTFRFPAGTFKADGTYDPDKTMFRIVDKETQKVISSVNVKITVMKNNIEFDFDPDKSSYDSRAETMLQDFHDKGQAMLDEIKDLNNQAKSNVSGDTATTANEAKKQADQNAGDISDLKGEVAGARGRFANMAGREDAQDAAINQKESIANANVNYAELKRKDAQQDATLAQKAGKFELEDKLAQMNLQPEMYADLNAVNAAYPNGTTKFIATDDGYLALYRNGQWVKGPLFQAAGIGDNSVGSKQVSTISASKIIDNQLSPSDAEGKGNISVVGNNEYVMIASMEVQTAANLVGTFIPLIITSKAPLILTANVSSNLDTGYSQPLYITDKNKNVLRQLSNVNVPDKSTPVNVKESLKITEDPGEYYLLIPSKATGVVTYRNLTVNASGSSASTVVKEINDLATKIDKSPTVTTRAFDTIVHNDVQLDKVSATDGIELTRDVNTITAKVNRANAAGDLQAIFFPVHVQNRNAAFTGTVKVAPIKFPGTYTQQIYLADAERNLSELLGTFPVNSQSSADFKVKLPSSQDFCIALITSVIGTFEFELTVNNSTGIDVNLEEYTTWLDSNTYNRAHMDISRIDYSNMTAKTIDGVEYVSPYHTFGVDNGRLNAIYVWTEKAGTYSFCVGKLDQNNLIVDGKYFDLKLAKGFNSIGMNIRTDAASNLFMKITDGVSLYEGNQAIKVQTSGQHINSGMYSGDYFTDNHGVLPFGYDVTSLSPTDRIRDVEEQQRQNTASIAQLKGATILTANNGAKYKLVVADDGTLSTKNMTPNKVRVFGNSLTANPEGFGLAASDPQHDYYYLMSQYILGKNSKADIQRHATGAWEWSTNSGDRQKAFDDSFKPYLDADTDLVIVQCMENVNSVAAKQTLPQDSITLLQNIKKCSPNAQIIWMYGWWGDPTVFDPAQNACDNVGAKGINLNDIGTQKSMQSYAGQSRTLQNGTVRKIQENEASHPSDAGMKAIADRLIANFDF